MGDTNTQTLLGVSIAFFALSLIAVGLRCFVRLKIVRAFGWDDAVMVVALALNLAFTISEVAGYEYGLGKKLAYFHDKPKDFERALLSWWVGQIFYVLACIVAKLSIIIALLRIAVERNHRWVLYGAMITAAAFGLVFLFSTIFQCAPVSFFWTRSDPNGRCLPEGGLLAVAYLYSIGAAATDLTIGLFPVVLIWNLLMDRRTKMAVIAILSVGCVAGIAVIVRIPFIHHLKDKEFLYNTSSVSILSNVETGLGITAGSLPTLRPLVPLIFNGIQSPSSRHRETTEGTVSNHQGDLTPMLSSSKRSDHFVLRDEYHAALAERR